MPSSEPKVLLLHLDIDITAPLVTFPKLSTSETYLLADLGKCIITNSIETEESSEMSCTDGDEITKYLKTDYVKATLSSVKLMMYVSEDWLVILYSCPEVLTMPFLLSQNELKQRERKKNNQRTFNGFEYLQTIESWHEWIKRGCWCASCNSKS